MTDVELIWAIQQENARLRSALSFYADKRTYQKRYGKAHGIRRIPPIETDGGERARKELELTE